MNTTNYIGLGNTGHDNALAIVGADGTLLFAEATERYLQNKRAFHSVPDDVFRIEKLVDEYCDPDADIVIAKSWSDRAPDILAAEARHADHILKEWQWRETAWQQYIKMYRYVATMYPPYITQAGFNLRRYCESQRKGKVSVKGYDHHLSHAATGCMTSPFDEAVCAILDGTGEGTATRFYTYKRGKILQIDTGTSPNGGMASLGLFYGVVLCNMCGFSGRAGEEWKVMGLAAYGELDEKLYGLFCRYMKVDGLRLVFPQTASDSYHRMQEFSRKPGASAETVANVAYTGQFYFSELMSRLLENLYDLGVSDNLVLGGGCALNSAYSGQTLNRTRFKHLHVYSAPADDGNAIGAALLAYYDDHPDQRPGTGFFSPYLGSTISSEALENLKRFSAIKGLSVMPFDQLCKKTVALLSEGKIIGWVQGRAEFGPRALGNRSILADPRDPGMKDKINRLVKFREEFRPFAPSILHEYGYEYFVDYQESPYMERTLVFKEEVRNRVPAVVHKDGTGRLQTVKREWNEQYYSLIRQFYDATGVPIVLNTSLNIMGKPIIHSVEDAIAIFYTTGIHATVIGDCLIEKEA